MRGTEFLPAIREGVAEAGSEEAWTLSAVAISDAAGIDLEEAELHLANALKWNSWAQCTSAMMRKYQNPEIPDPDKVREALLWLTEGPLLLNQDQLRIAVRDSPKAYLSGPAPRYAAALASAPASFKESFNELILEEPSVIDRTYNCGDDGCASECGNCWVAYENS